jgi:hypothetical protein
MASRPSSESDQNAPRCGPLGYPARPGVRAGGAAVRGNEPGGRDGPHRVDGAGCTACGAAVVVGHTAGHGVGSFANLHNRSTTASSSSTRSSCDWRQRSSGSIRRSATSMSKLLDVLPCPTQFVGEEQGGGHLRYGAHEQSPFGLYGERQPDWGSVGVFKPSTSSRPGELDSLTGESGSRVPSETVTSGSTRLTRLNPTGGL